jgi:spore germination cell wall hydrolase CwlJ-like protein
MIKKIALCCAFLITLSKVVYADEQRNCIARAIYWEARGLSEDGQRAVAEVIWNRVKHPEFPKTPCSVVYQRNRSTCQFSWVCTNARNVRPPNNAAWQTAWRIAGQTPGDLTNGALFFRTKRFAHKWRNLAEIAEVDNHVFFTNRR